MGRTKKNPAAVPEAAQEPFQVQDAYQDLMEPNPIPETAEAPRVSSAEALTPPTALEDEAALPELMAYGAE